MTKNTNISKVAQQQAEIALQGLATISKQIKESMATVTGDQVKFLVDAYYQTQDFRIAVDNQVRSVVQGFDGEGTQTPLSIAWLADNIKNQEAQIVKMLDAYTNSGPVTRWCKSITGIGPVLAAGLVTSFDISKCHYSTQFLSYAGFIDHINPWLGKEGAKKIVNGYLKTHNQVMDVLLADLDDDEKKNLSVISNRFGIDAEDRIVIPIMENTYDPSDFDKPLTAKQIRLIQSLLSKLSTREVGDLIMYCNKKKDLFTYPMLTDIAAKAHRTLKTILKGVRDDKKQCIDNSKDALIAYLAKPPYNTSLKTLCWKVGESFMKQSSREKSLYGRLYRERRALETQRNEEGAFANQAAKLLSEKNYDKNKDTYKTLESGRLTEAHIISRAKRYATQIFISHLFEIMYMDYYGSPAPEYYIIAKDPLHNKYIEPEVPFEEFITL